MDPLCEQLTIIVELRMKLKSLEDSLHRISCCRCCPSYCYHSVPFGFEKRETVTRSQCQNRIIALERQLIEHQQHIDRFQTLLNKIMVKLAISDEDSGANMIEVTSWLKHRDQRQACAFSYFIKDHSRIQYGNRGHFAHVCVQTDTTIDLDIRGLPFELRMGENAADTIYHLIASTRSLTPQASEQIRRVLRSAERGQLEPMSKCRLECIDRESESSFDQNVEQQIQHIISSLQPIMNLNENTICDAGFAIYLRKQIVALTTAKASTFVGSAIKNNFFKRQISSILDDIFARFRGKVLQECCAEMMQDVSEVLSNELSFFRLMHTGRSPGSRKKLLSTTLENVNKSAEKSKSTSALCSSYGDSLARNEDHTEVQSSPADQETNEGTISPRMWKKERGEAADSSSPNNICDGFRLIPITRVTTASDEEEIGKWPGAEEQLVSSDDDFDDGADALTSSLESMHTARAPPLRFLVSTSVDNWPPSPSPNAPRHQSTDPQRRSSSIEEV